MDPDLSQQYDGALLDPNAYLTLTFQDGSLSAIKMLLAAGCNVTNQVIATILEGTGRRQPDIDVIVAKLALLVRQDQVDYNSIMIKSDQDDLNDPENYKWRIKEAIYYLDDPKLNRLVLIQGLDFTAVDRKELSPNDQHDQVIDKIFDDLNWTHSANLAEMMFKVGLISQKELKQYLTSYGETPGWLKQSVLDEMELGDQSSEVT